MTQVTKWIAIGLPVVAFACLISYKMVLDPGGPTTLSWTAPIENENGERLADLAGYEVHCWAAETRYTTTIRVDDPDNTSLAIERLPAGSYNCAISAVDASGSVSALSNVVATSVQ